MMYGIEKAFGAVVLALVALTGLFISANAHDVGFTMFGYLLFLFGVVMLFRFIALVTGKRKSLP
jgi:hypothetical protein